MARIHVSAKEKSIKRVTVRWREGGATVFTHRDFEEIPSADLVIFAVDGLAIGGRRKRRKGFGRGEERCYSMAASILDSRFELAAARIPTLETALGQSTAA